MKKIMFVVIVSIILASCSAVDSIKIGGGYTNEDGTKIEGDVDDRIEQGIVGDALAHFAQIVEQRKLVGGVRDLGVLHDSLLG